MGFGTKGIPETLESYTIESTTCMSIARGASFKLKKICRENDIKVKFVDEMLSLPYDGFSTSIKLRDYQAKPCNQLVKIKNGLIEGVCGCGKTVILLKAIEEIAQKTLIIVHESKLQKQWVDNIEKFFGIAGEIMVEVAAADNVIALFILCCQKLHKHFGLGGLSLTVIVGLQMQVYQHKLLVAALNGEIA